VVPLTRLPSLDPSLQLRPVSLPSKDVQGPSTLQKKESDGGKAICRLQVESLLINFKESLESHFILLLPATNSLRRPYGWFVGGGLRDPERRSQRDSRGSRVDSGSVDMETPQSLSPRSPLDALEALDGSLASSAQQIPGTSGSSNGFTSSGGPPLVNGHSSTRHLHNGTSNGHHSSSAHSSSSSSSNNNHVIISSPSVHPVPPPVPVLTPQPVTISHSPSPATPSDVVMVGGSDSTHSLISDRRVPIVPPRRCRTRSPTPNTSHGKSHYFPHSCLRSHLCIAHSKVNLVATPPDTNREMKSRKQPIKQYKGKPSSSLV